MTLVLVWDMSGVKAGKFMRTQWRVESGLWAGKLMGTRGCPVGREAIGTSLRVVARVVAKEANFITTGNTKKFSGEQYYE